MCGIVGYIGDKRQAVEVILGGLKLLEYRGYDSAGVAVIDKGQIQLARRAGKLYVLSDYLSQNPLNGHVGIGHTRWATHGLPTETNAHPHCSDNIVVVHNGIIENYLLLKEELSAQGYVFASQTDSEVIAHLVNREYKKCADLLKAVQAAAKILNGSYSIAVLCRDTPDQMILARNSSPLIVGLGENESFLASDIPALLDYTRDMVILEDGDIARLTKNSLEIFSADGTQVEREVHHIAWSPLMAQKDGHQHFMHKEIFEQPRALTDTLRGRLFSHDTDIWLENIPLADICKNLRKVVFLACGTSYHAALVGKNLLYQLARLPVDAELGSEYRYSNPLIDPNDLVIAISQSGETADTLAAVSAAKMGGAKVLAITNVLGSSLSRVADWTLYTHAGPEIGVASTKAFTTQVGLLYLIALGIAKELGRLTKDDIKAIAHELHNIPTAMGEVLLSEPLIEQTARKFSDQIRGTMYLGRGISYPIALEGALKLKEITYIHAEGYPAGEMKHGPIALIEPQVLTVVVDTGDAISEKLLGNIQEVQARRGPVIVVAPKHSSRVVSAADVAFTLPDVPSMLVPLLAIIPLQLFAYHIANHRGLDVDQPRNLAKSVTVE